MTLEEIDQALVEWQDRLRHVDENLLALDALPTCQRLEGTAGARAPLDGQTQARVAPALAAMRELFVHRSRLNKVLDRAAALRKGLSPLWPSERPRREIEQLLRGPSIQLPPVKTPLAQRGLLTSAERETSITPEQLLEAMVATFDLARDAVMAVDHAWARLYPTLDEVRRDVDALQQLARDLDEPLPPELAAVAGALAALSDKVARDPLAVEAGLDDDLWPQLRQVRARLEARAGQRAAVQADQARARALLQELRQTHVQAEAAFQQCRQEIADPPDARPLEPGRIDGLASWLTTLEATLSSGRWPAAGIGLARWLAAAEAYLSAERATLAATTAPLAARDELLGRLSARQAQVETLRQRGAALDPGLTARAVELEALLRRRPTPLAEATRLAGEYETQLAALRRR